MRRASSLVSKPGRRIFFQSEQLCTEIIASSVQLFSIGCFARPSPRLRSARVSSELNAEIEHQTARDSTVGADKPLGERGAVMADTVGAKQA